MEIGLTDAMLRCIYAPWHWDKNPKLYPDATLFSEISDLEKIGQFIEEKDNGLGTGGMGSKISAVKICFEKQIIV